MTNYRMHLKSGDIIQTEVELVSTSNPPTTCSATLGISNTGSQDDLKVKTSTSNSPGTHITSVISITVEEDGFYNIVIILDSQQRNDISAWANFVKLL